MAGTPTGVGAIDIGGTKIAVGVIDESGRILAKSETPTAARDGFDAAMERVSTMLREASARAGVDLQGIGIGCTGPVDPFSGEIGEVDFLREWKGCNPVVRLAKNFAVSVAMENDADAAALAEAKWGRGLGKKNLICVTIGTGIGGGIILNGALYRGVGGAHPEIGHHVIDDSGPQCFCGAKGCWESLAAGPAIAQRAARHLSAHASGSEEITAEYVCRLARDGNAIAILELTRAGRYLGIGIANLITLYAPDLIVLSGSVMQSADLLLPAIREVIRQSCGLVPAAQVEVTTSALANDAALIGAAVVWRHRIGKDEKLC